MSNCGECGTKLAIDERINHQGKIVCGHCFMKMPPSHSTLKKDEEKVVIDKDKAILDLMEIVVNFDERIKELELRVGVAVNIAGS